MKNDMQARALFGSAYDDIPKSVMATLAWHFANRLSGEADAPGSAEREIEQELMTLARAGIVGEAQVRLAASAIRRMVADKREAAER